MPRLLNLRHLPPGVPYVRIDRRTKWGNPFRIGVHGTRDEVIEKHREWILEQPDLMSALEELRGQNLACWCHPLLCHGRTLFSLLGETVDEDDTGDDPDGDIDFSTRPW